MNYKNLLKIAYLKAQESTNPSTQNGAILVDDKENVILSASNDFPKGISETKERLENKSLRYKFSVHAERNVLFKAAKLGIKTEDLIMVCPWAACGDCAQAIIQAGIKKLIVHKQALDKSTHWQDDIEFAFSILKEANVEIIIFDGEIGVGKIMRSGVAWNP